MSPRLMLVVARWEANRSCQAIMADARLVVTVIIGLALSCVMMPKGIMPFNQTNIQVSTKDGRHVVLMEPLVYVTNTGEVITVPAGAESDGCSTPQAVWNLLPPFGLYWKAALLHDYLYRKTTRLKDECDLLFLEAMASLGVDLITREAIYEGVHLGGSLAFDDDRRPKMQAFLRRAQFQKSATLW